MLAQKVLHDVVVNENGGESQRREASTKVKMEK